MKNHNKKQKENSPSVSFRTLHVPLLLSLPHYRQKQTEKGLLNIKVQYSRWCREPTLASERKSLRTTAMHNFCCVLFRVRIRKIVSENHFSLVILCLSGHRRRLSLVYRVRRFSVNRKTFLSLSSPLPTPCKSVFNPADDLYFHPSLDCEKYVFVARQGVHNRNDFSPRAKGKPGEWQAGGLAGVGRERDRNKEGKLMIPHIHRDDLAVVVVAGGFEKAFSELLRN